MSSLFLRWSALYACLARNPSPKRLTNMASFERKWIHAQLNLAYRVVIHYARFLWPWSPRYGLERFVSNYVPEGLPWATPRSRELGHEPGRCTQCSNCDDVCPLVRTLPPEEFLGPMAMVSSAARAAPHFADGEETFRIMTAESCVACRACEAACPEDIPLLALADLFLEQLAVIEQAKEPGKRPALLPLGPTENRS